jgi:hypothetical protein
MNLNARAKVTAGVDRFLTDRVLTDRELFAGDCHSKDSLWILALKNAVNTSRFRTQFAYGQVVPLPTTLSRATPPAAPPDEVDEVEVERIVSALREDGLIKIDGRFKEQAARIEAKFDMGRENYEPTDAYIGKWVNPTADEDVLRLTLDPVILTALAHYYRGQPYLRDIPVLSATYPMETEDKERYVEVFNTGWHWDTPNLTTVHILLSDTERGSSHMLFAKKSHRRPHVSIGPHDKWYSEPYIRRTYEVVDCDGPQGTVYIFDNNGIHRLNAVPGTFRAMLQNNFTPGNSLISITERRKLEQTEKASFDPSVFDEIDVRGKGLSPLQLAALEGVRGLG